MVYNKIKLSHLLFSLILFFSCSVEEPERVEYAIVVHGGAGYIYEGRYTAEEEREYIAKLTEALESGQKILSEGGSSLDAVQKAIMILEDSPLFNAGRGSVFSSSGKNELDASIMDGNTLNAGGVAGIRHVKNPISLARTVMEKSPHVLMTGEGAESFAVEQGFELVDNDYFFTEEKWEELKRSQEKNSSLNYHSPAYADPKFGTVGCVALDKMGNLAAGTSTGGMNNKKFGRVGDSPIIGAGTYANNSTCAVSATGHGEYFMRNVVAYDISALMEYKEYELNKAAESIINDKLVKQKGKGGVIAIDKSGKISMPFNTQGMFRGFAIDNNKPIVLLYKN
jgi:beta-aspartyl-peptidase (threonine type)